MGSPDTRSKFNTRARISGMRARPWKRVNSKAAAEVSLMNNLGCSIFRQLFGKIRFESYSDWIFVTDSKDDVIFIITSS